jgi:FixJ family two-component response regulator
MERNAHSAVDPKRAVVLVLDDDPRVREALSSLLRSASFQVSTFESAAKFLQATPPDAPNCLILDLQLPDINGLELQRKLAERGGPPIIFISGHGDIPSSVQAIKAGAVEFLPKPFSDRELLGPSTRPSHETRRNAAKDRSWRNSKAPTRSCRPGNVRSCHWSSPVSPTGNARQDLVSPRLRSRFIAERSCARWQRGPCPNW